MHTSVGSATKTGLVRLCHQSSQESWPCFSISKACPDCIDEASSGGNGDRIWRREVWMDNKIRHYSDEEIDISFDARRCIHAEECVHGLPVVFETARRPWVLPNAAS